MSSFSLAIDGQSFNVVGLREGVHNAIVLQNQLQCPMSAKIALGLRQTDAMSAAELLNEQYNELSNVSGLIHNRSSYAHLHANIRVSVETANGISNKFHFFPYFMVPEKRFRATP